MLVHWASLRCGLWVRLGVKVRVRVRVRGLESRLGLRDPQRLLVNDASDPVRQGSGQDQRQGNGNTRMTRLNQGQARTHHR